MNNRSSGEKYEKSKHSSFVRPTQLQIKENDILSGCLDQKPIYTSMYLLRLELIKRYFHMDRFYLMLC